MSVLCIYANDAQDNPASLVIKDSVNHVLTNTQTTLNLFLATDSTGQNAIRLKNKEDNSPSLKIKNQGRHTFVHINPNRRQINEFHFFADGEAPITSFSSPNEYIFINDTIVAASGLELSLKAKDNISGVKDLMVSIDMEPFREAPEVLSFAKEKAFNLRYYSVDKVGNIEPENKYIIIIDNTDPKTNLEIDKDLHENIVSERTKFSLSGFDKYGIKETWYWFNDENPQKYKRPLSVSRFNEGEHQFYYYSIDKIGNKEQTQTFEFYIDKTPPIIFEEILGNTFIRGGREYSSGRSQLRITAIDNKAGVQAIYYSLDGKNYNLYEGPVFLSMVSGDINISSYALDNVNNKSYSSAKGTSVAIPYVDLNAPDISHSIRGPQIMLRDTMFVSPKTQIILNAIDYESGLNRIIFRISSQPEKEYNKPIKLENHGYHQIYYTAFDNVDNANTDNLSVFVDSIGPEINYEYNIKPYKTKEVNGMVVPVFPKHLKIFLSSSDIHTGSRNISFSLNNGAISPYRGVVTSFSEGKLNALKIKSVDMLGNETVKEIQFYIEAP